MIERIAETRSGIRRLLFLTGTRADFGKLKPLLLRVEEDPAFEAHIFVTGMHMLERYGYTAVEITRCGFRNIFPHINQIHSASSQMDLILANTIQGLGHYIREFPPDMIVVHGDRVEALAGAIVGALNNVLVAHVEGGELSGTVDELIRHSVTKLSHIHFVSNEDAQRRLVQMGELPEAIFVVGSPDIDVMLSHDLPPIEEVRQRYEIPFDEFAIFVYHPVTTERQQLRRRVNQVVTGLRESDRKFVVIYPNNDAGAEIILEALAPLEHDPKRFRVLPSLRFEYFLSLLKSALAIVGNSSAGIREAPVYGVPTINIGTRQMNRFEHSSIVNVPEDAARIRAALSDLPRKHEPSSHFGAGNSAELFHEYLHATELWSVTRQKQFRDLQGSSVVTMGETHDGV